MRCSRCSIRRRGFRHGRTTERGTRLVLIAIDLPEDYVRRLFAAIAGSPAVDTPDRAALADNPLAIAGYRG